MNRGEFITLLENPSATDPATIRELDELIGIFPYFQGAYMLLLKVLKENADIRFEKRLKQNAIYVADRELLYHYLMDKPTLTVGATVNHEVAVKEEPIAEAAIVAEAGTGTEAGTEHIASAGNTNEPLFLTGEIESIEIDGIKGGDDDDGLLVIDDYPEQTSTEGNIELQGTNESARPEEINVTRDNSKSTEFTINSELSGISENVETIESSRNRELTVTPENIESAESAKNSENDEADEAEKEEDFNGKPISTEKDEAAKEQKNETEPNADDLIDRFIAANPRISPIRAALEEQDHSDISQKYTESTEGLVSETLAKIYIKQKYYYRAIDIYEKLSLNYPEKNSYFASRIQMIKDLINQK